MKNNKQIILKIIHIISLLAFIYGAYSLIKNNFLPTKYRTIAIAIILAIYILIGLLLFLRNNSIILRAFLAIVLLVIGGVSVVGAITLNKGIDTLDKLNQNKKKQMVEFSLLVLKDSDITKTEELKSEKVMTALEKDKFNVEQFSKFFKESKSYQLELIDGDNYNVAAKKLLNKETKVILLNESFRSIIQDAEGLKDFSDDTRAIEKFTIEVTIDPEKEAQLAKAAKDELDELRKLAQKKYGKGTDENSADTDLSGFAIYVSGIDSYGGISTSGRSDVNIVVSVNPKTRKIVTASIPRDSYLPIAGGGNDQYDKLTHAGIYGVDSSKSTIQKLLEMPIEYYARVNFSSLINMVDVLGGIYVDNPVSFSALGFDFPAGKVYLTGESALAFSRERYSLPNGDFDRGKNQMRVIEGMIRKAMSPSILLNYQGVLSTIMNSTQTDLPSSKIVELINNQIDQGGDWTFEATAIEGKGTMGLPSYAMPGWNLYMFVPDKDSVEQAAQKLYLNMK